MNLEKVSIWRRAFQWKEVCNEINAEFDSHRSIHQMFERKLEHHKEQIEAHKSELEKAKAGNRTALKFIMQAHGLKLKLAIMFLGVTLPCIAAFPPPFVHNPTDTNTLGLAPSTAYFLGWDGTKPAWFIPPDTTGVSVAQGTNIITRTNGQVVTVNGVTDTNVVNILLIGATNQATVVSNGVVVLIDQKVSTNDSRKLVLTGSTNNLGTDVSGTKGWFSSGVVPGPVTVATLPASPTAGQVIWASDAVTARGTGGMVYYDGSNWRNSVENSITTANITNFIINALAVNYVGNSPLGNIAVLWSPVANYEQPLIRAFGASGAGSASGGTVTSPTTGVNGGAMQLLTGITSTGNGQMWGAVNRQLQAGDVYMSGGIYSVSAQPDGTDNYWAGTGINNSGNAATVPSTGAIFLYDRYNANSVSSNATFTANWTNNWICVSYLSAGPTYVDSGLPATISSTAPADRLMVIATSTSVLFYTNGALSATITTTLPTGAALFQNWTAIKKTLGGTSRTLFESSPFMHTRYATGRTLP